MTKNEPLPFIREAPAFRPTILEWTDPIAYIETIRPVAETYGIARIIPPEGWKPPFCLDKQIFKFETRIQHLNQLEASSRIRRHYLETLKEFYLCRGTPMRPIKIQRQTVDLYELHKLVKQYGGAEKVTVGKKWSALGEQMGFDRTTCTSLATQLRHAYEALLQPYEEFLNQRKKDKAAVKTEAENQKGYRSKRVKASVNSVETTSNSLTLEPQSTCAIATAVPAISSINVNAHTVPRNVNTNADKHVDVRVAELSTRESGFGKHDLSMTTSECANRCVELDTAAVSFEMNKNSDGVIAITNTGMLNEEEIQKEEVIKKEVHPIALTENADAGAGVGACVVRPVAIVVDKCANADINVNVHAKNNHAEGHLHTDTMADTHWRLNDVSVVRATDFGMKCEPTVGLASFGAGSGLGEQFTKYPILPQNRNEDSSREDGRMEHREDLPCKWNNGDINVVDARQRHPQPQPKMLVKQTLTHKEPCVAQPVDKFLSNTQTQPHVKLGEEVGTGAEARTITCSDSSTLLPERMQQVSEEIISSLSTNTSTTQALISTKLHEKPKSGGSQLHGVIRDNVSMKVDNGDPAHGIKRMKVDMVLHGHNPLLQSHKQTQHTEDPYAQCQCPQTQPHSQLYTTSSSRSAVSVPSQAQRNSLNSSPANVHTHAITSVQTNFHGQSEGYIAPAPQAYRHILPKTSVPSPQEQTPGMYGYVNARAHQNKTPHAQTQPQEKTPALSTMKPAQGVKRKRKDNAGKKKSNSANHLCEWEKGNTESAPCTGTNVKCNKAEEIMITTSRGRTVARKSYAENVNVDVKDAFSSETDYDHGSEVTSTSVSEDDGSDDEYGKRPKTGKGKPRKVHSGATASVLNAQQGNASTLSDEYVGKETPSASVDVINVDNSSMIEHLDGQILQKGEYCEACMGADDDAKIILCDYVDGDGKSCDLGYHIYCLRPALLEVPEGLWMCPSCLEKQTVSTKADKSYCFDSGRTYTLSDFKQMADKFMYGQMGKSDSTSAEVENKFWELCNSPFHDVTVEYGADLHSKDMGSGFPCTLHDTVAMGETYAADGFNLNNIPMLYNSLFGVFDQAITGMTVPWLYVGMCFSTFCWHVEDHFTYSINYNHFGAPKTWYGVPGSQGDDFDRTFKKEAPELFEEQPDLIQHLVTILRPNALVKHGINVCRTDQKAGEFVVTFPQAYHAGFNQGFNFAEAVNFAPVAWLPWGRKSAKLYQETGRYPVFSFEEILCAAALRYKSLTPETARKASPFLQEQIDNEETLRKSVCASEDAEQGVSNWINIPRYTASTLKSNVVATTSDPCATSAAQILTHTEAGVHIPAHTHTHSHMQAHAHTHGRVNALSQTYTQIPPPPTPVCLPGHTPPLVTSRVMGVDLSKPTRTMGMISSRMSTGRESSTMNETVNGSRISDARVRMGVDPALHTTLTFMHDASRVYADTATRGRETGKTHVPSTVRYPFLFEKLHDDERTCTICNCTCFFSSVTCVRCDEKRMVCLSHSRQLCRCDGVHKVLNLRYTITELRQIQATFKARGDSLPNWEAGLADLLIGKQPSSQRNTPMNVTTNTPYNSNDPLVSSGGGGSERGGSGPTTDINRHVNSSTYALMPNVEGLDLLPVANTCHTNISSYKTLANVDVNMDVGVSANIKTPTSTGKANMSEVIAYLDRALEKNDEIIVTSKTFAKYRDLVRQATVVSDSANKALHEARKGQRHKPTKISMVSAEAMIKSLFEFPFHVKVLDSLLHAVANMSQWKDTVRSTLTRVQLADRQHAQIIQTLNGLLGISGDLDIDVASVKKEVEECVIRLLWVEDARVLLASLLSSVSVPVDQVTNHVLEGDTLNLCSTSEYKQLKKIFAAYNQWQKEAKALLSKQPNTLNMTVLNVHIRKRSELNLSKCGLARAIESQLNRATNWEARAHALMKKCTQWLSQIHQANAKSAQIFLPTHAHADGCTPIPRSPSQVRTHNGTIQTLSFTDMNSLGMHPSREGLPTCMEVRKLLRTSATSLVSLSGLEELIELNKKITKWCDSVKGCFCGRVSSHTSDVEMENDLKRGFFRTSADVTKLRKQYENTEDYCILGCTGSAGWMIQCELCNNWYHGGCLKLRKNKIEESRFLCRNCKITKRPTLSKVVELILAARDIPVQMPILSLLISLHDSARDWQIRARAFLALLDSHPTIALTPEDTGNNVQTNRKDAETDTLTAVVMCMDLLEISFPPEETLLRGVLKHREVVYRVQKESEISADNICKQTPALHDDGVSVRLPNDSEGVSVNDAPLCNIAVSPHTTPPMHPRSIQANPSTSVARMYVQRLNPETPVSGRTESSRIVHDEVHLAANATHPITNATHADSSSLSTDTNNTKSQPQTQVTTHSPTSPNTITHTSHIDSVHSTPSDRDCKDTDKDTEGEFTDQGSVHCVCRLPYKMVEHTFMVECTNCDDWFHNTCVGITIHQAKQTFMCPRCIIGIDDCTIQSTGVSDGIAKCEDVCAQVDSGPPPAASNGQLPIPPDSTYFTCPTRTTTAHKHTQESPSIHTDKYGS
eukprot:CFRG7358T1